MTVGFPFKQKPSIEGFLLYAAPMGAKIIGVVLVIWIVAVVIGTNRQRDKTPVSDVIQQYDRRDPKQPMYKIYSDSKCSAEEQLKGIHSCP